LCRRGAAVNVRAMHVAALRAGRLLIALAICAALGGHWFLLQSVAWTGMLITYSRDAGIVEAVGKTFDGGHPCGLCLAIEKGREQERERSPTAAAPGMDLKFLKPETTPELFRAFSPHRWPITAFAARSVLRQPAVPPPRGHA
jgi:hypothetical protein